MRVRKGLFYTVATDTFLVLMAIFMLAVETQKRRAVASESRAVALANENGDLQGKLGQVQTDLATASGDLGRARAALGKTRRELDRAIEDGAEKDAVIDDLGDRVGNLQGANAQLSQENGKLRSHLRSGDAVTVVVLIDTTPSMKVVLTELLESLQTLFEYMPKTSKDFRVGVLAFQNGVVAELPITQVHPVYADGGRSQRAVLKFVAGLTTYGNQTNHLPVFQKAMRWFETAHPTPDADRKERLIFLGDVGPSEVDNVAGYSDDELKTSRQIVGDVRKWASSGDRAVESLYAQSEFTKSDPGAKTSRSWFRALGQVSKQSAFYTDSDALLWAVLHASFD